MITVTTVGYGDIVPVTPQARLFDTFVVTPIRLFVWLIFLGTAYEFLLKNVWETWRMSRIQEHLHGHVIVTGFGASGDEAVRELLRLDFPATQIVVVDQQARGTRGRRSPAASRCWRATPPATPRSRRCRSRRARCVAVAAGRDDTSILIVLTAHGARAARADQRGGARRGQRGAGAPGRRPGGDQPGELRGAAAGGLHARAAHRRIHGRPRRRRRQGRRCASARWTRTRSASRWRRSPPGSACACYRGGESHGFWEVGRGAPGTRRRHPRDRPPEPSPVRGA